MYIIPTLECECSTKIETIYLMVRKFGVQVRFYFVCVFYLPRNACLDSLDSWVEVWFLVLKQRLFGRVNECCRFIL